MVDTKLPTRKWTGRRNLIFFGDSISFGELVNPHSNWVTKLSRMVEDQYGTNYLVINCSINGNTTRQALERMPFDVQRYSVDLLCIQFGMNDCNYWASDKGLPRVSRLAFAANLREIIDRVVNFGALRIFLNTNHPTTLDTEIFPHTNVTYQQSNESFNQAVRELSQDTEVTFNDLERSFMDHVGGDREKLQELLLPADQLHLSKKGHDLYLDYLYPRMERAILDLLND